MTRLNRILLGAGLGALLALVLAAYFVSPIFALRALTVAAKSGDVARLERSVDFPAVREGLKSQLKTAMTKSIAEDPDLRDSPFAAFGQMLMSGVVDKAVDAYATPDAIATMVATSRPPSTFSSDTDQAPATPAKPVAPRSEADLRWAYQDLNHFRATYRDRAEAQNGELGLVLERRGLFSWKLVRIELPVRP